ncbi:glycosyltransferase family 2 protein [Chitinophaga sp.]|uniref:glycosyltransferase family 2 protein n=1 Tax=Chitinophaga sp. TaxID=1869181 RepID=UPI0031DAD4A4
MQTKFIVLVTFRNVKNFIEECYNSLAAQTYDNFEVYFVDDESTDGCLDLIPDDEDKVHKQRNPVRLGPTGNIANFLTTHTFAPEDVIVLLDGDDYLNGHYVFQILDRYYNGGKLLTYGQYMDQFGNIGHCTAYTEDEVNNLRQAPWKSSHLKTFKFSLWQELMAQDPELNALRDATGGYYMASSDMAVMFPLIEIAGHEHIACLPNIVYVYRFHDNNDHAKPHTRQLQYDAEAHIRQRLPMQRLVSIIS